MDCILSGVLLPDIVEVDEELADGVTELMVASYKGDTSKALELLTINPSLVHTRNSQNGSALEYAVEAKQTRVVDILLGYGADLDAIDPEGQTILHKSVLTRHLAKVQTIAELGANLDYPNGVGDTALHIAIQNGLSDIVSYLVKMGCDMTTVNTAGFRPLECAFFQSNSEIYTLLDSKVMLNKNMDSHASRLLLSQCFGGNVRGVEQILSEYGNTIVDFGDPQNGFITPLQAACQQGNTTLASLLYSNGASLHITSTIAYTPLTCAAIAGENSLVKWLLSNGARIHHRNCFGRTPLHCTTIEGHLPVVQTLVENGIMLNVKTLSGTTALAIASESGDSNIVKYLLQQGACIDVRDKMHDTPLISAIKNGNTLCAQYLLEYGANVNLVDHQGLTPLMTAAFTNKVGLVKMLVQHGADVNLVNAFGDTALVLATKASALEASAFLSEYTPGSIIVPQLNVVGRPNSHTLHDELFKICKEVARSVEDLQRLQDQGADLNATDSYGRTPLMISAVNSHVVFAEWLLENGAHVDISDQSGMTPLMYAAEKGYIETATILVNANADTLKRDVQGRDVIQIAENAHQRHILKLLRSSENIPLHKLYEREFFEAVKHLRFEKCKELIRKGVDVNCVDKSGNTALSYCLDNTTTEAKQIAALMCQNGLDMERRDNCGHTLMEQCLHLSNTSIAEVLLKQGACIDYIHSDAFIDPCLYNDTSIVELFITHVQQQNTEMPCFVEFPLQFLITNLQWKVFNLLDQSGNVTSKLWTNQKFWTKCTKEVFEASAANLSHSLCNWEIQHTRTLLRASAEMGIPSIMKAVLRRNKGAKQRIHGYLEELLYLALDHGHYEVVTLLSNANLLVLDSMKNDTATQKPDHNGKIIPAASENILTAHLFHANQSWMETVDSVYAAVMVALSRIPEGNIIGISRSWSEPLIYVHAKTGDKPLVAWLQSNIHHIPCHEVFHIKQVLQENTPHIIKGLDWNKLKEQRIPRTCWMVSTAQHESQVCHIYQTIGCFIRDTKGVIWAVTDANCIRNKSISESYFGEMTCPSCIGKIGTGNSKEWNNVFIHGTQIYVAKGCQRDLTAVNLVAIPLGFRHEIPLTVPDPLKVLVFNGTDQCMLGRNVYKSGIGSSYSDGIIIDVNTCFREQDGIFYPGGFMVAPKDLKRPFAVQGDIGASVIDSESGLLFGLLLATMTNYTPPSNKMYTNVVFCLRLSHSLHFLYEHLGIQLGKFRTF